MSLKYFDKRKYQKYEKQKVSLRIQIFLGFDVMWLAEWLPAFLRNFQNHSSNDTASCTRRT
jgi:hypothetical protein